MERDLFVKAERFPIAGSFTISRGSKTEAAVVTYSIAEGGNVGRGECVPYGRYGETVESVIDAIENIKQRVAAGMSREALQGAMPAGAARNAVDCALWDLEAKKRRVSVSEIMGWTLPRPLVTAFTISLGEPDAMEDKARENARRPLLKVKVGTEDDIARIEAVCRGAPHSRIILDANEGWNEDNIREHLLVAARNRVALIEQPLPAGNDDYLSRIPHPVPICADESVHTTERLEELLGRYDAINIKLDKTGGLTEALKLRDKARSLGFGVMVGCMVGTSLAMAPAVLLAQNAEFVDLDGPLLLARDREPGLIYEESLVTPPSPQLWG